MPKTTPDNVPHSSPAPVTQSAINQSWGKQMPANSPADALAGSPTKHPIAPGSLKR